MRAVAWTLLVASFLLAIAPNGGAPQGILAIWAGFWVAGMTLWAGSYWVERGA